MKFLGFNEWVKLHEKRMHNNSKPKQSDVEILRSGKSVKVDVGAAKPRIPIGKPAAACGVGPNKKKYDRNEFKRNKG